MKTVLIISIFAVCLKLSLCDEDLMTAMKTCLGETKINETEMHNFWKDGPKWKSATPNMKCYLKCTMEKMGHFKAGVLDTDASVKYWAKTPELKPHIAKIEEVYKVCKSEKGTDDCDTAIKILECLDKNGFNKDMLKKD